MKRVLIVTYHWPPSGGIGVLRCLKIAKYLRNFGWEPVIYAPLNAQYEYIDNTNIKDIPENITVLRHKIFEPFNLFKKLSGRKKTDSANPVYISDRKKGLVDKFAIWVRANYFIPDARALWIKPSVKYLTKYLETNPVDAIFSDGPPHTNTVIAMRLSQKFGIPWLADFQDPWTQVDYYTMFPISKRADKIHHRLEQEVFASAYKITIASPTWAADLESIGAFDVSPVFYGYDDDDYKNIQIAETNEFSIAHAGVLGVDRKPGTLLKVLADIKNENPAFADALRIKFAGQVDYTIEQQISQLGLSNNYIAYGKITRPKAIEIVFNSQILLLPLNKANNAKGRIPGKLFELLRANKTILCLGPDNSDTANIITNCNGGVTLPYDNYEVLKQFIIDKFNLFINNKLVSQTNNIEQYSNFNQTKIVAQFLDQITNEL